MWSCAAADVALERRRLHAELESRVEELAGSRARIVEAGDEARRRIERDLHDGAQQRLVSLAIALRLTEDRIKDDPETRRDARRRGAPGGEPSRSRSCASWRAASTPPCSSTGSTPRWTRSPPRSQTPVRVDGRARRAAAGSGGARRLLRRLRRAGQRRQVRAGVGGDDPRAARRRRGGHRDRATTASAAPTPRTGPACAASPTASRRSAAGCSVSSPPGRRYDAAPPTPVSRCGQPHADALEGYPRTPAGPTGSGGRRGGEAPACAMPLPSLALALIALHILDDNFLQPEPGTSAGRPPASAGSCRSRCSRSPPGRIHACAAAPGARSR